ncbi:MAG: hypothetical protein ACR2PM_12595 [Hyphomicrobiales bacterium]
MTRLPIAIGILMIALAPAHAGSGKSNAQHTAQSKTKCERSHYVADCSKSIRDFMSTSHPRLSDASLRQLYISKGFGR